MEKPSRIKKDVFTVPDGYFEQLNRSILDATVNSRTAIAHSRTRTIGRFTRIFGYAAAIAVLFVIVGNLIVPFSKNAEERTFAEAIENEYIDNILNSYTIDDYTFYCYLTESDYE